MANTPREASDDAAEHANAKVFVMPAFIDGAFDAPLTRHYRVVTA